MSREQRAQAFRAADWSGSHEELSSSFGHALRGVAPSLRIAVAPRAESASKAASKSSPASSWAWGVKRGFDIGTALTLLVVLMPGLLLIAAAIKLTSPGPVLFRQQRYGLNNELFEILKFRSMSVESADTSGIRQTQAGDPRVTPLGRILRRSSLDELPQLINVLRGDMSLVGPRPHVPGMLAADRLYEDLVPYYFERHRVRPGVTGLAQANGLRGSTKDAAVATARIDQDVAYVENWSLMLDMRILWTTAKSEFLSGSGI